MFVTLKKAFQGQPAGARIEVSDADGDTLIKAGIGDKYEGDALAPLIAKSMEGMLANIGESMSKAMDNALAQFGRARTLSSKGQKNTILGGADGDPSKTFGAFLLAVRNGERKALEEMGSSYVSWGETQTKAAMSTQTGTTGGYLVPTEHYDRLLMLVTERSIVRKRATIIPMSGREVEVPIVDQATVQSVGDTAFLGGLVARWTEEAAALNQTEPAFKQQRLTNYELSGYSKISNTLLADGGKGLEAFLFKLFAEAIAWYEDFAFLRGNGVGKPLGVQSWPGFIAASRSAASAFTLDDYADMLSRWLPNYDSDGSCWVAHPTVLAKLIQIVSTASGHSMFINSVGERPKMMLSGLPLEISEKVPALNTAGDITLNDFSKYLIGDRQQVEIAFSEHAGFTTNQTFWRFVTRVAGQPWLKTFVTLADGTSTISPFVGLAAG